MTLIPAKPLACVVAFCWLGLATAADPVISYSKQIQPLLADKCYECHGAKKQKGGSRVDEPAWITKGGKNGAVVVAGNPEKSPLYARTILPADDDEAMPNKGDRLTKGQTELLRLWILQGASFLDKPASAPAKPDAAPSAIPAPSQPATAAAATPVTPATPASVAATAAKPTISQPVAPVFTALDDLSAKWPAPDAATVKALGDLGAVITPLSRNQAALDIDLSHLQEPLADKHLQLVEKLAANILWLDLSGTTISDSQLHLLPKLKNLRRLHLEKTAIGNAGLAQLKGCAGLEYLNLYGTKVGDAGLTSLQGLAELKHLYVWQSQVTAAGVEGLDKALPDCDINNGPEFPAIGDQPAPKGGKKGKKAK